MKITNFDKKNIINKFPNIKPFYEKNLHKKVNKLTNLYVIIPKGRKYFVWFTKYKGSNVCMLLLYNKKTRRIDEIEIKTCSFNGVLTSGVGTILYGTLITIDKYLFLNVESIYYYKGYNLFNENEYTKLNYLENFINKDVKQRFYGKNSLVLGLSIISESYEEIKQFLNKVSFTVYCIQHRNWNYCRCYYNERIVNTETKSATFKVKASIKTDIYMLYCMNNNELEYHSSVSIPTYKLSVYMNSLFRNIRENYDLDNIEMSDDEEDFEDISEEKYLKEDICYNMKCMYNYKQKKWSPVEISKEKIINKNQILFLEK